MVKINLVIAILLLITLNTRAQFDIDKFISISLNTSQQELKALYPNAKWEEKSSERGSSLGYYDWLEPNSLRISFSFNTKNEMSIKSISNGKRNEEDAKKVFNQLKGLALNKFGNKFEEKSFFGVDLIIWKSDPQVDVLLTIKDERASLVIAKKGSIPMI
ncbi:MAG: hypothetical protein GYA14_02085 [Ignavibacteria bacterium]|nr:hypothetical protein [Ignavibacteria bacterium]